jgi:hypothetical protein
LRYYPAPQHPAYIQGTSASKPAQHPTQQTFTQNTAKNSTAPQHNTHVHKTEQKQNNKKTTQKQNNKTKE